MIHHASFSAREPEKVARGLARLLGARALAAPCPPFPDGAWFVCLGDDAGTLLEILPWERVQAKSGGASEVDEAMSERTSTHFLMSTPRSTADIEQIAGEEGWEHAHANAGFFRFTKVWVENRFLVELMTADQARGYRESFGAAGIDALDGKLRELERVLRAR